METDGRDTNRAGRSGADNVVPFPRDWIGPLDDLVPFGSAPQDPAEHRELEPPFVADSFWSASSASLHQVVEAPAANAEAPASTPAEVVAETPGESGRQARLARPHGSSAARLTMRSPVIRLVASVAVVATAMVAITLALETGSKSPRGQGDGLVMAAGLGESAQVTRTASNETARLSRLLVRRAIEHTSRRLGRFHRSAVHHHAVARSTASPSSVGTATQVNVSYDVTQPTTAASTGTPTVTASKKSVSSGQTNPGTASVGGASSGEAGPSGPGAPFGPGQLNGG